jgi:hypothetical protein
MRNKIKLFILLILVGAILFSIIRFVSLHAKPVGTTVLTAHEPYTCVYENNSYISKEKFTQTEEVNICIQITSNKPEEEYDLTVYIYKDEQSSYKSNGFIDYSFIDSEKFYLADRTFQLSHDFEPGRYIVDVYYAKDRLCSLRFEILDTLIPDLTAFNHHDFSEDKSIGISIIEAIEDYYNDNQIYPDNLEELVPEYIQGIPPTTEGQPFQFVKYSYDFGNGPYMLYFVSSSKDWGCAYHPDGTGWECGSNSINY